MLLGEFVQRLDAKNRVTLPAKFRHHFADGVVVARGFDGCLSVYAPADWESFTRAQLGRLDPFSREGRRMSRFLYGGASEAELDRQGRVMIPPHLLEHARLERDLVVVGVRDRLEIWALEEWRRHESEYEGSVEDVAERLARN